MMGRVSVTSGSTLVSSLTCSSTTATAPTVSPPLGFAAFIQPCFILWVQDRGRDGSWVPWGRASSQTSWALH